MSPIPDSPATQPWLLNAQEAYGFTPDLTLLDAMIESLTVTPTSP